MSKPKSLYEFLMLTLVILDEAKMYIVITYNREY